MPFNLSATPDDTPIETTAEHFDSGTRYVTTVKDARIRGDLTVVRVGEWLPTDEQEVPREKWATITPGSRVRIETAYDTTITGPSLTPDGHGAQVGNGLDRNYVEWEHVARVWVLDEPDPDADAKAAIDAALPDGEWTPALVLNNLRANGFDVVKAGAR